MPPPLRTRFAPSPTGYLHLGHAAHIIYVWGVARALGAEVLLRMEDHDRTRCRPEYEAGILEDLEWLGFSPDLGNPDQFRKGPCPYRQSDCDVHYREAVARWVSRGRVYACDCSRRTLQARTGGASFYDGYCRDRNLPLAKPDLALRLRLEAVRFDGHDLFDSKPIHIDPNNPTDPVLRDRNGCWTYHFAVVLDDLRQGVNVVIRGADLAEATALQVAMGQCLGRPRPPAYAHHPLITDPSGTKLSKRDFAQPLRELRAAGHSAANVLGLAAHRVGLQATPRPQDATGACELVEAALYGAGNLSAWRAALEEGTHP